MASVTSYQCDITGEKFDEGAPGSAHPVIKPVRPDDYDKLDKDGKAAYASLKLDLSAAGFAKLVEFGGTRGKVGAGRPAKPAPPAETPPAPPAEAPKK